MSRGQASRGWCGRVVESLESRRLLSAGGFDLTFSGDGRANIVLAGGASMIANDVAVQSDGKVVVVGTTTGASATLPFVVARFNANGTQDMTFGGSGNGVNLSPTIGVGIANAVKIEPNGKIVVVGSTPDIGNQRVVVAQYLSNGVLDSSFAGSGFVVRQLGSAVPLASARKSFATDVALQHDGKIVIVGSLYASPNFDMFVARITTLGQYDTSFDGDGARAIGLGGEEFGNAVAIDYSGTAATNTNFGKIVVVGFADKHRQFAVARVNTNGSLDGSFKGGGKFATHFSAAAKQAEANGVVVQSTGKIVLAGSVITTAAGTFNFGLMRLNSNGNTDTGFGVGGIRETDFGADDPAYDVIIGQRGNLIVGGSTGTRMALAAYTPNGNLDPLFGSSGKSTVNFPGNPSQAMGLALSPGGKIVAAGGINGATARLLDRSTAVSVAPIDLNGAEAGLDKASFMVTRDQSLPFFTRVFFSVGGTATKPGSLISSQIDYTATGISIPNEIQIGTPFVDIAPNQTSTIVTLTPINDTRAEGDETATFNITPVNGYDVIPASNKVVVTIHDDEAPTTNLSATADAYVKDGTSAHTNFGTTLDLQVKFGASGFNRLSYIKFDLSSVSTINSVKLQMFGKLNNANQTNLLTSLFSVGDTSWTETGISFTNAPAAGANALATATILDTTLRLYEFDVTTYVKAQKAMGHNVVSFVLKNSANSLPFVVFNSREAASGQPKLAIT